MLCNTVLCYLSILVSIPQSVDSVHYLEFKHKQVQVDYRFFPPFFFFPSGREGRWEGGDDSITLRLVFTLPLSSAVSQCSFQVGPD